MAAKKVHVKEQVSASRKLGADDAKALLDVAREVVIAARGGKYTKHVVAASSRKELLEFMLGRTGNLRAPMMRVGHTVLVGFSPEAFQAAFVL
ncbi:MAG: ArsC family (seleno)protein [Myxococcota bacterium]